MTKIILDCYTDEPAGLGVPPYIGTYPRYLFGKLMSEKRKNEEVYYFTIDDLRLFLKHKNKKPETKTHEKTNITIHNLTKNSQNFKEIFESAKEIYVVLGVHVPGKYLTAVPATIHEINTLFKELLKRHCITAKRILTGPAATEFGTRLEGGKFAEKQDLSLFNTVTPEIVSDYGEIAKYAVLGVEIVDQIVNKEGWNYVIAEIETARGCGKGVACSFCTEPLKNKLEFRKVKDIVDEVKALNKQGVKYFRLGKQSDFFAWDASDIKKLLSGIRKECNIDVLHIDNIDPVRADEEKVKLVVEHCTSGNIAAMGVESFDAEVVKKNNLNSNPEVTMRAIKLINKIGAERGENGMPKFVPGLNIIFGLIGEGKKTQEANMKYLQEILDSELLLRRINIRQVAVFPGTQLEKEAGNKYLRKNKKYYWKWRNEIRQKIDNVMLKKLVPKDLVLKDCIAEIYDGKTTFLRQIGTYPLIIGVKERLELGKFYNIKVTGHMLRSIVGEVV
ncbi:radical SAM protein [Candidatus Woesearchaeota archaeon]|jgi:radical SAM superfamily enzyme with C-terminal helix-hairpin-helix motif|nr:radical SAM protein [Candidatus Woesearchaeota archaeon]MBT5272237.1 radical SAM protein [Candidatus Woesearchaeota archaeon]MBT6040533.1 radical SAM protein [Candidatus Woesearchaeota archaeon]MBT6336509.1 radical SAM protein [Candidatus Woesearchaeota archaeon]MBT7927399.1 radical SAM protein [Candidatus Woesearchaeota archaeon]